VGDFTPPLAQPGRASYEGIVMSVVKGVVVVEGISYRVSKLYAGKYEVVRILDDQMVGTFESEPRLEVEPEGIEPELLKEIAIVALKQAKISWSQRPPSM
jgi:hypothetical protein